MSEIEDKNKSLERSKKMTTSLLELLGPEALNSLVPGGSLIYGLAKILFDNAAQFHKDRKQARIFDFHNMLLEGTSEEDFEGFIKQDFSTEDYYSLLSSAIRDDEDAKTRFYSNMFKALMAKKIPEEYRLHFIKSVRELSYNDIEMMRKMYIRSKYEIKNDTYSFTLQDSQPSMPAPVDPIRNISIQALERLGFIEGVQLSFGENQTENVSRPTKLIEHLVNVIYYPDDLTPISIGKEAWKRMPPIPILSNDLEKHSNVINVLSKSLEELNIKCFKSVPNVRIRTDFSDIYKSAFLILCLDYSMSNFFVETFVTQPQVKDKKFIKILLSAPDEKPHDPIPEVKEVATYNFTSEDSYEIDKFKDFMKIETKGSEE